MVDKRFPNWDVDVEKGTIYNFELKHYVGNVNNKSGYITVSDKGYLHRIIWMVANQCEIPEGYHIHHIDGNKQNNSIYNLELLEPIEHQHHHRIGTKHSTKTKEKMSNSAFGHKNHNYGKPMSDKQKEIISKKLKNRKDISKKIAQYTLEGELVKIWDSMMECKRNGFSNTNISGCCLGERKTHKGFIWKYYKEEKDVV